MKKLLLVCVLFCTTLLFAQTSDTERGQSYYNVGNYAEALICFQRAAKSGDALAQTYLGIMYRLGKGVKKNPQISLNMFNKAIAQNYPLAMIQLGHVYHEGDGVSADLSKAFSLYKKAADLDSPQGQFYTAYCYNAGKGIAKDSVQAFKYFVLSANNDYEEAAEQVAYFYYIGKVVPQNYKETVNYLEKADDCRTDFATYLLGALYYRGMGTEKNPIKAEELLSSVAEKESNAAELLPEVKKAADLVRYRIKMAQLYEEAWKGCTRYDFADGNDRDHPARSGKCYCFTGNFLQVKNTFYHAEIFSITFWIKDFTSGPVVTTLKTNAPKPVVFPSVSINGNQLTFSPGPYADVQTPFNYSLASLKDEKWHLIAVTFGHKEKKLYVDGRLVESKKADTAQISQGNVVRIGGGNMKLANLRLYAHNKLSGDEVRAIYMMEKEGK